MRVDLISKNNRFEKFLVSVSRTKSFRISGWIAAVIPWIVLAYAMATMPPGAFTANMASNGSFLNQLALVMTIIPCAGYPGILLASFFAYWIGGACGFVVTKLFSISPF